MNHPYPQGTEVLINKPGHPEHLLRCSIRSSLHGYYMMSKDSTGEMTIYRYRDVCLLEEYQPPNNQAASALLSQGYADIEEPVVVAAAEPDPYPAYINPSVEIHMSNHARIQQEALRSTYTSHNINYGAFWESVTPRDEPDFDIDAPAPYTTETAQERLNALVSRRLVTEPPDPREPAERELSPFAHSWNRMLRQGRA